MGSYWNIGGQLITLIGLTLLLFSCSSEGDSGNISSSEAPSPQLEQQLALQAVEGLLDLYRIAVIQEDIDRLQELLQPEETPTSAHMQRQEENEAFITASEFRENQTEVFRTLAVTNLDIPDETIQVALDHHQVAFREIETTEDPITFIQRTRVFRSVFQLIREEIDKTITFRIAAVRREGPLVDVTTVGRVLTETLTRVIVRVPTRAVQQVAVETETGDVQELQSVAGRFHGAFIPPDQLGSQVLLVRLINNDGSQMVIPHRYRLQARNEQVVQSISGTEMTRIFAVAVGPDGTLWAGGDRGGSVFRVPVDSTVAILERHLLENDAGRVEDIVIDDLGRIHFLFVDVVGNDVVRNGARVLGQDTLCPTFDIADPGYPFKALNPDTDALEPSVSSRAITADRGDIWLFGSDGGVARVADTFRDGVCPTGGADVHYAPFFNRIESGLASNTVPAFVVGRNGTLGFGTAAGFILRQQNGQFTTVPFNRALALPQNPRSLEQFFQHVAQAIFEARPLAVAGIRGVSFETLFGVRLIKEDIIFSTLEDTLGGFWVGTLGGGLRRLNFQGGVLRDTFHLTRAEVAQVDLVRGTRTILSRHGLVSNIIFALAQGPAGTLWAATDEGVSRIRADKGALIITNFSRLDGLPTPVRDVVADQEGGVWMATDGGLFRLRGGGQRVQGVVRDTAGAPVQGADVQVSGTPFHTVTDTAGRFWLSNLPPGRKQILINGELAVGGPFAAACAALESTTSEQLPEIVMLAPLDAVDSLQLQPVSNTGQIGMIGDTVSLKVVATDAQQNPVANLPVTVTVLEGPGLLPPACVTTDTAGLATVPLTITAAGVIRVQASIAEGEDIDFTIVEFTVVGTTAGNGVRLRRVSGNSQVVSPGQVADRPFVMRMEDQFGNPLVRVRIRAEIRRGQGEFVGAVVELRTDERGQASFLLRANAESEEDILVRILAPDFQEVRPVQFLTIVGEVDTPDIPLDLTVVEDIVMVADRRSGLQLIDVSNPDDPQRLRQENPIDLDGIAVRLALDENQVYVGTNFPLRLYILDKTRLITDFDAPIEGLVLGRAQFTNPDLQRHGITGIAVEGDFAYLATDARTANGGRLLVTSIRNPTDCSSGDAGTPLAGRPRGLAIAGDFAYVPAGETGLLIFDISDFNDPTKPNPAPKQLPPLPGLFFSDMTLANGFAYVIETRQDEEFFTVLDLRDPAIPQRLGSLPMRMVTQVAEVSPAIAVDDRFAYLARFASGLETVDIQNPENLSRVGVVDTPSQALNVTTAGGFVYVSDQVFGVQVIPKPTDADLEATVPDGPQTMPPNPLPLGTTTVVVDANASREDGNGTEETPYRSLTDALQALRLALQEMQISQDEMLTLRVLPGVYSPLTTQEIFPLDLTRIPHLMLQSVDPEDLNVVNTTMIDAAFTGDILFLDLPSDRLSSQQVIVEGLTLTHGAHGVFIRGSTDITLRHNRITENIFAGISVGQNVRDEALVVRNTIESNSIEQNGQEGIGLFEKSIARIRNNIVDGNGEVGVFVGIDAAAEIAANMVTGNGNDGIRIDDQSTATIKDNTIRHNGTFNPSSGSCLPTGSGVQVDRHSTDVLITNNTIEDNIRQGVHIQDGSTATIAENPSIAGNGADGVLVRRASAIVRDNTIRCNGANDVEGCRSSTVSIGEFGTGVRVDRRVADTTTDVLIASNTIEANRTQGILIDGAIAAVMGNPSISGNGADGILIQNDSVTDETGSVKQLFAVATVQDNTIHDNQATGLSVTTNATAAIDHNIIRDNADFGINIDSALKATVTNNDIRRNQRDGLRVVEIGVSISPPVEIIGNTMHDNGGNGLTIQQPPSFQDPEQRTRVQDNHIGENIHGIALQSGASATISGGNISQNIENGIILEASTARIGCDGGILQLARNGVGIKLDNASRVHIDSEGVLFENNGTSEDDNIKGSATAINFTCP